AGRARAGVEQTSIARRQHIADRGDQPDLIGRQRSAIKLDRIFQPAPLHIQPPVRPRVKREYGRIAVRAAERLYFAGRKKMAHTAFEEFTVERVDDIE